MLRVIFHVGPHKTGTTTIQDFLHTHRTSLSEIGFIYPTSRHFGAHHEFAYCALGLPTEVLGVASDGIKIEDHVESFIQQLEPGKALLISAEDLSQIDSADWIYLRKVFEELSQQIVTFELIYSYRDIFQLAKSLYSTLVRFGECRKFEEIQMTLESRFKKTYAHLMDLSKISPEQIRVKTFEYPTLGQPIISLLQNFTKVALEVELMQLVSDSYSEKSLNESLDPNITEQIRQFNILNFPDKTVNDDTGKFDEEFFYNDPRIDLRRNLFIEKTILLAQAEEALKSR
jgi:hypothetical protein